MVPLFLLKQAEDYIRTESVWPWVPSFWGWQGAGCTRTGPAQPSERVSCPRWARLDLLAVVCKQTELEWRMGQSCLQIDLGDLS